MEKYITITGLKHYYGKKPFKIGTILRLVKEPDNDYDGEAIVAELPYIGKIGYVANSPYTVAMGTMSGGRIYDTFAKECYAEVKFVVENSVIAKIVSEGIEITITKVEIEKNVDDDFFSELLQDGKLTNLFNDIDL